MLQDPNKFKNYRLRWLSKPLRLAKFESLWIQVCSIVAVFGISGNISLLSLSFDRVFSMILLWFPYIWMPLQRWLLLPFIVLFWGPEVPLIPPFCSPRCQCYCYASHFGGWSLPHFLIVSFFWCLFPKSSLLTFLPGMSLKSYLLISFPSRLLHLTFSDSAFLATFPFVIFLELADSLSASLKVFRTYFPSCFFLLGSLRYQLLVHK